MNKKNNNTKKYKKKLCLKATKWTQRVRNERQRTKNVKTMKERKNSFGP